MKGQLSLQQYLLQKHNRAFYCRRHLNVPTLIEKNDKTDNGCWVALISSCVIKHFNLSR